MKIYVLNYDLNKISTVVTELLKLTMTISEGIEIYSTEGIFYVDNNTTYKLLYNHESIIKLQNYYNELDLAIDKSVIIKEITSQLPRNNLANTIKIFVFKKHSQSNIKFIIIGHTNTNSNNTNSNNTNSNNTNSNNNMNTPFMDKNFNKDLQIVISDFYMDVPDDIDLNNIFIKEEISEFLSLLNKY
jgi:hypothetical protein